MQNRWIRLSACLARGCSLCPSALGNGLNIELGSLWSYVLVCINVKWKTLAGNLCPAGEISEYSCSMRQYGDVRNASVNWHKMFSHP